MSKDSSSLSEVSSEPSSTAESEDMYVVDGDNKNKLDSLIKKENKMKPKKAKKSVPKTLIVFAYFVIPLTNCLLTMSMLNVAGIVFQIMTSIHILLMNLATNKYNGVKAIMAIEFILSFVVLLFSTNKNINDDNKAMKYLGFTFNNVVTSSPTFAFVAAILSMIVLLITFSLLTPTPVADYVKNRLIIIQRPLSITIFELIWIFSAGILGGTFSSIFFAPIFIYYIYIMICYSVFGSSLCYTPFSKIIYFFSILYTLAVIFFFSIGLNVSYDKHIKPVFLSKESQYWLSIFFSCVMTFSATILLSFKTRKTLNKYHPALKQIRYPATLILMCLLVIFASFYACYISLSWIFILFVASFFPSIAIRKFFYPLLGLFYNIGFFAMYITGSLRYLDDRFSKRTFEILSNIGLFSYDDYIYFCLLGFVMSFLISQVGRILHTNKFKPTKPKEEKERNKIVQFLIDLVVKGFKWIKSAARYIAAIAIIVIGVTWSYQVDGYSYQFLLAVILIIYVLGLYNKFCFSIIKIISSAIILLTFFFTTSNPVILDFEWTKKWGFVWDSEEYIIDHIWPVVAVAILSFILAQDNHFEDFSLGKNTCLLLHLVVAILLYLLVFLYETTVFSLYYLILATLIVIFMIYEKETVVQVFGFFVILGVCIHLAYYVASLFPSVRNFLGSLIYEEIISINGAKKPSVDIALLSVVIFFSSISYPRTFFTKQSESGYILQGIYEEFKAIARSFYFYVSWGLILGFAVCNYYPSCIKLLFCLLFMLGHKTTNISLVLMIIVVLIQYLYDISPSISSKLDKYSYYVGLHYSDPDSLSSRNITLALQLAFVLFSFIYFVAMNPKPTDQKFSESFPMKLYVAFYSLLHYLLKPILELTLCIATLYNPSIFGFLSFFVLCLVMFWPKALEKGSMIIYVIFNICFIAQYFLWLNLPKGSIEVNSIARKWTKFFGLSDTKTSSLLTTCLSGMIFIFYRTFGSLVVDYTGALENLPVWCQDIIKFCCTNTYEFCLTLAIILSSLITSFDGTIYLILSISLIVASKFFDFGKNKSMTIASAGLLLMIFSKVLGRIPYFISMSMGSYIEEIFDIPLDDIFYSEQYWILIFAFIRFCNKIMESRLYNDCMVVKLKLQAFRFMRARRLIILKHLDQEILTQRYKNQVNHLAALTDEQMANSIMPEMSSIEIPPIRESFTKEAIFDRIVNSFLTFIVKIVPLNHEAGINGLTLFSLTSIMKKMVNFANADKTFQPSQVELDFLKKLPPSIPLQFHSVSNLIGYKGIRKDQYFEMFIRYSLMALRNFSFLMMILISIIYCFVRPFIYSFILIVFLFFFFISNDSSHSLLLHIVLIAYVSLILIVKSLSNVNIISNLLYLYLSSNHINIGSMNVLSLFGINPNESMSIEILVFFFVSLFIYHRFNMSKVHSPESYTSKFKIALPGFPQTFAYGEERTENKYGLMSKPPKLKKILLGGFESFGLYDLFHVQRVMYIELFSFILLLLLFPSWCNNFGVSDGIVYFIVLLLHIVFCLISYFFVISHKYTHLYFANILWLAYEFAISFFFCQNDISYMPGSLIFYLIVRLISHFCYSFHIRYGKTILDFVYPDFKRDGHSIFSKNVSLKRIPFIFEIKSLFHWMSQDTYVKYNDFLSLGYLRLGLECTLIRKYKRNPKILEKRFRIGILLLACIAILIFLPLFFMFPSSEKVSVVKNTPVEAILSIGYTEMPKLWKRHGIIKILSSEEKESMLNSTQFYSDLTYSDNDEIAVLTFKTESSVVSTLNIRSIMYIGGNTVPIVSLKLYFNNTVDGRNLDPVLYTTVMQPLTDEEITENINHFNSTMQLTTQYKVIDYMKIYQQGKPKVSINNETTVKLSYVTNGNYWETNNEISIVVWCQKSERKEYSDSTSSTSGLGLYILLLISFGLVLRYQINNHIDYFWFEKMRDPEQIYKRFLLMDAFRSTGDAERESEIAENLIELFRSHQKCIDLTG